MADGSTLMPQDSDIKSAHQPSSPKHLDFCPAARNKVKKKKTTREKIDKLVSEGAKNYPAYLKLIYTGESDFSSEDEAGVVDRKVVKSRSNQENKIRSNNSSPNRSFSTSPVLPSQGQNRPPQTTMKADGKTCDPNGMDLVNIGDDSEKFVYESQHREKAKSPASGVMEDSFYDTLENTNSPQYNNAHSQHSEPLTPQDPAEREQQEEEWRNELAKMEDEIATLRSVLGVKVHQAAELKHKLGITAITEFKQDFKQGITTMKTSDAYQRANANVVKLNDRITGSHAYKRTNDRMDKLNETYDQTYKRTHNQWAKLNERVTGSHTYKTTSEQMTKLNERISTSQVYQKTSEKLHQVGGTITGSGTYQKTAAGLSTFKTFASKKIGDMRNSNAFKSFEEKVGGAYTNVKGRVSTSKSENSFEEALSASNDNADSLSPGGATGTNVAEKDSANPPL